MMEKKKVLVLDDKRLFLEMFKKNLNNEFKFTEGSFMKANQIEKNKDFDAFVFVVYTKLELIEFLNLDKKSGSNVLVCLFDEKLYSNVSFLEEVNDLILFDGYKTKRKIVEDLKLHFKNTSDFRRRSDKLNLLIPI